MGTTQLSVRKNDSAGDCVCAEVGVGDQGNIGEVDSWAFPEYARRVLACGVETFNANGVETGAQAQGAVIDAHGITG